MNIFTRIVTLFETFVKHLFATQVFSQLKHGITLSIALFLQNDKNSNIESIIDCFSLIIYFCFAQGLSIGLLRVCYKIA